MAQPRLAATFFASNDGVVVSKAPPLTERERVMTLKSRRLVCDICGSSLRRLGKNYSTPFDSTPPKAHVDHIFPRSRGGQNHPDNLRILCQRCNCSKGAK